MTDYTFTAASDMYSTEMKNKRRPVYENEMYDRRVVREHTYSPHNLPHTFQPNPVEIRRQQRAMRPAAVRKKAKDSILKEKKHADAYTEVYLEELSNHIEVTSVKCQTDAFPDKPTSPLFIPPKSGKDVATQIEEGELFDFDLEVQPVVQGLVGKIMEQALLEVQEKEELATLRARKNALQELLNAELVEIQRLEEQQRLHTEEKDRRIKQQRAILEKEKETVEKIAARTFAQHYLADLLPSVYRDLRDQGYFYDPVQREIETEFLPWLMAEVNNTLEKRQVAQIVLDMFIQEVVDQNQEEV